VVAWERIEYRGLWRGLGVGRERATNNSVTALDKLAIRHCVTNEYAMTWCAKRRPLES
jgi:hypothetical protein